MEHRHFKETSGAALLDAYYGNSKIRAARERYPNYRWNANRFKMLPTVVSSGPIWNGHPFPLSLNVGEQSGRPTLRVHSW